MISSCMQCWIQCWIHCWIWCCMQCWIRCCVRDTHFSHVWNEEKLDIFILKNNICCKFLAVRSGAQFYVQAAKFCVSGKIRLNLIKFFLSPLPILWFPSTQTLIILQTNDTMVATKGKFNFDTTSYFSRQWKQAERKHFFLLILVVVINASRK